MERVLCPRVHFKIIIFDLKTAYVGSANLTGAGLGMKGENTRNFEAGVLSSNKDFVKKRCRTIRQRLDGSPLQRMQAEGVLWGPDWSLVRF
ncbi:MAG: hypothetical protein K6B43_08800 [Treponema sp.]|nr:hypothetical protein [Treponema sp.]